MKLSSILLSVYSFSGITDAKRRTKNRLLPYVTESVKYEDLLDELQLVEMDGIDSNNTNRFIPSDRYIWQWPQCKDFKCSNHIKTERDIQIACKYCPVSVSTDRPNKDNTKLSGFLCRYPRISDSIHFFEFYKFLQVSN